MSQSSIGLALGGGGARGLAHIGVLKVFEKEGIPIDFIAGSSMGGLIAIAYAAGIKSGELENEALSMANMRRLSAFVGCQSTEARLNRRETPAELLLQDFISIWISNS